MNEYAKYVRDQLASRDRLEEVFQVVIDDRHKI